MPASFELTTPLVLATTVLALAAAAATRTLRGGHLLAVAIFAVYLVGVASFVILPLRYDPELARQVGPIAVERLVNGIPFFLPGGGGMSRDQLVYNVVLTIPFGFGLPFVRPLRLVAVVIVGVVFSIGIETAQLLADVAYLALPTWSVDINDVILNSLGVVIGVVAFRAASLVYRSSLGRLALPLGPLRHFHETLMGARAQRGRSGGLPADRTARHGG